METSLAVDNTVKTRALFFSRGRGHGHAIPDMAIVDELESLAPEIAVSFASYATGAATFKAANRSVFNMGLAENNGFLETLFKACDLILDQKPNIIISHEEFAALPAARLAGIPSIFISAWF